ncbi:LPXTG cell wall anchor domain-containing protein [Streptococcus sp. ZJ93]|uniref:LPXTG cell wall anchor domain-containing protein n=1 Tax=Streptococcus handemini TaxID=3161188 RepID=UPI0032EF68D8
MIVVKKADYPSSVPSQSGEPGEDKQQTPPINGSTINNKRNTNVLTVDSNKVSKLDTKQTAPTDDKKVVTPVASVVSSKVEAMNVHENRLPDTGDTASHLEFIYVTTALSLAALGMVSKKRKEKNSQVLKSKSLVCGMTAGHLFVRDVAEKLRQSKENWIVGLYFVVLFVADVIGDILREGIEQMNVLHDNLMIFRGEGNCLLLLC